MFLAGATAVLATLLLAEGRPMDRSLVAVIAALGLPIGVLLFWRGARLPAWCFHVGLGIGCLIVGVGVGVAGAGTTPVAYATFMVWVALYAGYFSSAAGMLGHGAVALLATTWGLSRAGQPFLLELLILMAVAGVVALVSHRLSHGRALSELDPLTGTCNRRGLSRHLDAAIDDAAASGAPLAVALLDLDRFRDYNDRHGARIGDSLLLACARRWNALLPEHATLGRYGGDEFVVVLPGHDLTHARSVVEMLRVATPDDVSTSAGLAAWVEGESQSMVVARADTAMYRAKRAGRDRTEVVGDDPAAAAALHGAVAGDQLVLHYQPVRNVRDGSIAAVEALVRWEHPTRGLLGPGEFIGLAETSGAIHTLGRWVLHEACTQMQRWRDEFPSTRDLVVNVNISPVQLDHPRLVDVVRRTLQETGLPADVLVLELTEGAFESDMDRAAAALWELKEVGVRLAMDDFGTGYSSLSRLRQLPFDVLKVDRSFVAAASRDPADRALLRAIAGIATTFGMQTVAEGVRSPSSSHWSAPTGAPTHRATCWTDRRRSLHAELSRRRCPNLAGPDGPNTA